MKPKPFKVRVRDNIKEFESKSGYHFLSEMYQDGKTLFMYDVGVGDIYKEIDTKKPNWGYHKDWLIFLDNENDLFDF